MVVTPLVAIAGGAFSLSFVFMVICLLCMMGSLPYVFLCQGYGDPRDLHSFPTRRSSDLLVEPTVSSAWTRDTIVSEASTGRTSDRKSTRLNSSHQIISYAVFCLKKKMNKAAGDVRTPIRQAKHTIARGDVAGAGAVDS